MVNAGASGGAAVGVILNGVLVSTSGSIHNWRFSFWIAAVVAVITIAVSLLVFHKPITKPASSKTSLVTLFRKVLADRSGRMIVATSAVSGVAVFTLATFLTATSIDEMAASDTQTALLLWIAGSVGVISALVLGRLGDKRTPILAIAIAMASYATTLVILAAGWSYPVLVLSVVGYGILNGPVWGLMGATASRRFNAEMAVGTIALGLAGASVVGAIGNSLAGWWIETTGSMRGPVLILAFLTSALTIYLMAEARRTGRDEIIAKASQ
jgi:predicted MFS family arabinose efflux permease